MKERETLNLLKNLEKSKQELELNLEHAKEAKGMADSLLKESKAKVESLESHCQKLEKRGEKQKSVIV